MPSLRNTTVYSVCAENIPLYVVVYIVPYIVNKKIHRKIFIVCFALCLCACVRCCVQCEELRRINIFFIYFNVILIES